MQADIKTKTTEIFRHVLKKDDLELQDSASAKTVDGWDSLTNMILISEIEKNYNIHFTFREIIKINNFGELCEAIERKQ